MFLEKCGKFFFSKMRPFFFFAWIALPPFLAIVVLSQELFKLQDLQERFAIAAKKEHLAKERQLRKMRCIERYSKKVNPYFLDQFIESFPLLQQEQKALEALAKHPAFPPSPDVAARLSFLQKNRLTFREEAIEMNSEMKEVSESQQQPVQMDEADLKQILSFIEDVPIDGLLPHQESPQMLIKQFRLKKLETPLHTEVFEVEMDLLKREFTPL